MPKTTEQIKSDNREFIEKALCQMAAVSFETVSEQLPQLLLEHRLTLDTSVYTPADPNTTEAHGIGRHLIYDHKDSNNPFSIWVFALAPRQKTSIHDHSYKGSVTVLEGPVSEKYYRPTGSATACCTDRADRYRFHSNQDDLSDNFVHQLKRRKELGPGVSCTLHIYNMEAQCVNAEDGNTYDRRNLNQIYRKDKTLEGYKGEYRQLKP